MIISALLATYNRKATTLECLQKLFAQKLPPGFTLEVFLTDDASTDGTAEAVAARYPQVHVLSGTGSLFWAGGMRNSWRAASLSSPDYYLLLNDDTMLFPGALSSLLQTSAKQEKPAICIGSTVDESSGITTYGGRKILSRVTMKDELISGNTTPVPCDLGNGNIMLVPSPIVSSIGILSEAYTHGLADWDYTLRAGEHGFQALVMPEALGSCANDHGSKWPAPGTPLRQRVRHLYHHKGLAYREYLYFLRTHFPRTYFAGAAKLWLRTLFPFVGKAKA